MSWARITVRIPDDLKWEMDKHPEINWSAVIRNHLEKYINYELNAKSIDYRIIELLNKYKNDIEKLWTLHIYLTLSRWNKSYVLETAELIFGKDMADVLEEIENDLNHYGIDAENYQIRNELKEVIDSFGYLDKIYLEVIDRIKKAPEDIKKGIWLLTRYINESVVWIHPEGLNKTYKILTGEDINITIELVKLGLLYKGIYSSRAYFFEHCEIPEYTYDIAYEISKGSLLYIEKPSRYAIEELLKDEKIQMFFKWMGTDYKSIEVYQEGSIIKKELEEKGLDLSLEEFNNVLKKLIEKGVLIIDYFPRRKRAGRRRSQPSEWEYRITNDTLNHIGSIVFDLLNEKD